MQLSVFSPSEMLSQESKAEIGEKQSESSQPKEEMIIKQKEVNSSAEIKSDVVTQSKTVS